MWLTLVQFLEANCLASRLLMLARVSPSSTVVPLFKDRGKAEDPTDYRPVSLLPAFGKALDKIQTTHLLHYLEEQKFISTHQFGFMPEKSTTLQLLYLTHHWFRALEREECHCGFLRLPEGFWPCLTSRPTVPTVHLRVSEWSIKWLTSYLSERQISVRVGSTMSEYKTISCGVPQGSHLGPILFTVFINNFPSTVNIPTEKIYVNIFY